MNSSETSVHPKSIDGDGCVIWEDAAGNRYNGGGRPTLEELEEISSTDHHCFGEDIPTCPKCGARTSILKDESLLELHECLNPDCVFRFTVDVRGDE